jgi:hypothetical protein
MQIVENYLRKLPYFSTTKTVDLGKRILEDVQNKLHEILKNKSELGKELLVKHLSQLLN